MNKIKNIFVCLLLCALTITGIIIDLHNQSLMAEAENSSQLNTQNLDNSIQQNTQSTVISNHQNTQIVVNSNESNTKNLENGSDTNTKLKYIFLFIGDGMSYPQIQLTSDYLGALKQEKDSNILSGNKYLSFMKFPVAGSAITYDSSSFCPDSASTGTSISTGNKTYSGTLNLDETKKTSYETIAEKLKKQLGYKIGIITTVNINHATPAAFYAHQDFRTNYYDIGLDLVKSNFDFFAGGAFKNEDGDSKTKKRTNLYDLAVQHGYKIIRTQDEASKLTNNSNKIILIAETLADKDSLSYAIDAKAGEWTLRDYVRKGIEVLDNETGFFMMVESGKIDWACHANDAGSAIYEVNNLNNAVNEALDFYNKHPEETLILVTGDHETGGLSIGYTITDYETYLTNFKYQKISNAKFDSVYISNYKKNKTPFRTVLSDIKKNFGLITSSDANAKKNPSLVLTNYEYDLLKSAYEKTLIASKLKRTQKETILYGTYEPLTVTITHILNNKSGVNFSTFAHSGLPVGVFAKGVGETLFNGYYDNNKIFKNLKTLLEVN